MNDRLSVLLTIADYAAKRGIALPPNLDARLTVAAKSQEYYERRLMTAVRRRYDEDTDDSEFLAVFVLLIGQQLRRAYMEGIREAGLDAMDTGMETELFNMQMEEEKHARSLLNDIKLAILAGLGWAAFRWRMAIWSNRYLDVRNRALVRAGIKTGILLMWRLGATEKHCRDCAGYEGEIKTAQEWNDIYRVTGHKPQARELECKGYNCDCALDVVKR